MKKFIYCILIALIVISCKRPNDPLIIPTSFCAQTPAPDANTGRNRAACEEQPESWDDSDMGSRTYAVVDPNNSNEYFQYWSENDAISVFFTTKNLQYKLQSITEDKDVGFFEIVGDAVTGNNLNTEYFYSVYPYKESTQISKYGVVTYTFPEVQHYNWDSYANGENGMIAIKERPQEGEDDGILYFQNFCSYLQLRLVNDITTPKIVKKITLTAKNSGDKMAGTGTVEIKDENSAPIVSMKKTASSQITLDCGSGVELSQDKNDPTKFWFVLPGSFEFKNGFDVSIIFTDQTYFKKSTNKNITIQRNHIKPMAPIFPEYERATGPIRYRYEDISINEPFPLKNTFYGEDGKILDIVDQIYDKEKDEWVVLLSGTLKAIGDNSFEGPGPDIEYIKVNNEDESITINNFAFYNCTAESIQIYNDVDAINKAAFSGSSIEELKIDGDVNIISADAFSSCKYIKTVEMNSVQTIGEKAFYMCSSLTSVSIPDVKVIQKSAFEGCTSLTEITLESIVELWDAAFMGCKSLVSAVISEDCIMIGEGAFCNATNLKTVYCYATLPPFIKTDNEKGSYVFDNTHDDICIYIPWNSMEDYQYGNFFASNVNNWGENGVDPTINWWAEEYYDILEEMLNNE